MANVCVDCSPTGENSIDIGRSWNADAAEAERTAAAAIAAARASEPRTLEDQIRFCEVPAPPFGEAARGEVLRQARKGLGTAVARVDVYDQIAGL